MDYAHRGGDLVDVLASVAAGVKDIYPQFVGVDLHLHLVDHWQHRHRGCRGVYPALGLGVGDTLNPVHAAFKLHPAENALALYLKNDLIEPAHLSGVGVHDFDLPALVHGIAGVGPVEVGSE